MTHPVLEVRGLGSQTACSVVLDAVTFDVAPGEFVAVMGKNGAGKSTLFDLIAGLRKAAGGDIVLAGAPLARWTASERARLLAHLPQDIRTDQSLDVESLVSMGRYAHQSARWFESESDREAVLEAMRRCECLAFARRSLGTLSGGERQRVFLAACLAQDARVLLLDEPATFLDVDQQLQCFSILRAEADRGVACLAVTHDVNLALTFCTRVIVLSDGHVAHDAPASSALETPSWLALLSHRMAVGDASHARSWVSYR